MARRQRGWRSVALIAMAIVLAAATEGCTCFQKEYVAVADPRQDQFLAIASVDGARLTATDGATYTVAGLATEDPSAFEAARLRDALDRLAGRHVATRSTDGQVTSGLLATDGPGDRRRLLVSAPLTAYPCYTFVPDNVFPIRVKVPPRRYDVAEICLLAGLARLDAAGVSDPERLAALRRAEASAREAGLGVWADPGQRLLLAVAAGDVAEATRLIDEGADVNTVAVAWRSLDFSQLTWTPADPGRAVDLPQTHRGYILAFAIFDPRPEYDRCVSAGMTPLLLATAQRNEAMVDLLRRHKAHFPPK